MSSLNNAKSMVKKTRISKSKRAGLVLPVARVHRCFRDIQYGQHKTRIGAAIYTTAVLEYLVAEVLELAGNAAKDNKKKKIQPRHIQLAVRNDHELDQMLRGVDITNGGVIPHIEPELFTAVDHKKTSSAANSAKSSQEI